MHVALNNWSANTAGMQLAAEFEQTAAEAPPQAASTRADNLKQTAMKQQICSSPTASATVGIGYVQNDSHCRQTGMLNSSRTAAQLLMLSHPWRTVLLEHQ